MTTKPDPTGPDYKATAKDLQAAPPWAIAMQEMLVSIKARGERTDLNVDITSTDVKNLRNEVSGINYRVTSLEQRAGTTSIRVDTESRTNMEQDAAIAILTTKVDHVQEKTDATHALVASAADKATEAGKKILNHPAVKKLGMALVLAATAYVTYATTRVQALMEHPAPTQVTATVVPAPALDAGAK